MSYGLDDRLSGLLTVVFWVVATIVGVIQIIKQSKKNREIKRKKESEEKEEALRADAKQQEQNGINLQYEQAQSKGKIPPDILHCPKCNSKMILRNGRYGKFYGCAKYPNCRGTRCY
jgi:hypothetical protein